MLKPYQLGVALSTSQPSCPARTVRALLRPSTDALPGGRHAGWSPAACALARGSHAALSGRHGLRHPLARRRDPAAPGRFMR